MRDIAKQRAAQAEYARKRRAEGKMHVQKMREILYKIKEENPCADCGVSYPYYVMDFDHVRGEKVGDVNRLVYQAKDKLLAEVEKCEVVCSNCHRIRTMSREQHLPH